MNVLEIVLDAIEEIVGIDKEELRNNLDLELLQEGILDSLSLAMVITTIESKIRKSLHLREMNPAVFTSIRTLVSAISEKLG